MTRTLISSGSKLEDKIGFSRAVRMGNLISVAGTAAIGENGESLYPGNLYLQTKECFIIAKKAIEQAGGKIENIIRTRIMLVNIKDWEQAAKAHGEFFRTIKPACTFVEVSGFIKKEWLVEIEVDCIT